MKPRKLLVVILIAVAATAGLDALAQRRGADEPAEVTVQHILIGFKRSVPGKKLDRTKKEALALALELFERAKKGEDFEALVREYTDEDNARDLLVINDADTPMPRGALRRRDMVARFGDVAFSLDVGEIGLAKYHAGLSPYGWHIVKRLE